MPDRMSYSEFDSVDLIIHYDSIQGWRPMGRILRLDGVRSLAFLTIFVHYGFGIPPLWAGVDIFFVRNPFSVLAGDLAGFQK